MIPARLISMLFGADEGLARAGSAIISGPFCVESVDVYAAGAVIAEGYSAGAVKAEGYRAGAVIVEGTC